jgi:shikimate 5-dehydrogenase
MHNKQIEEALFPKDKIIHALQQEVNDKANEIVILNRHLDRAQMYANRYKELRAIGVILAEEGTDPKYLKGEDMDAFFAGIGIYRGATPMSDLLAQKMIQTKNVLTAQILEKLYDTGSESQSKRDENT